jgi:hypothetical protein
VAMTSLKVHAGVVSKRRQPRSDRSFITSSCARSCPF